MAVGADVGFVVYFRVGLDVVATEGEKLGADEGDFDEIDGACDREGEVDGFSDNVGEDDIEGEKDGLSDG